MKSLSRILSVAGLAFGLALTGISVQAQQVMAPQIQNAPAASVALAKELLAMKHAESMYAGAVPNIVTRTKDTLLQTNLNYQKDLNEVAVIVAKELAGRESEIGDAFAKIYATQFTEQELKDLVAFYKTPLGQKLLKAEPVAIEQSLSYRNAWGENFAGIVNGQFRAEMRKRGKEI
jgi:hypothetical protein